MDECKTGYQCGQIPQEARPAVMKICKVSTVYLYTGFPNARCLKRAELIKLDRSKCKIGFFLIVY